MSWRIRPAEGAVDRAFILEVTPRLADVASHPLHDGETLHAFQARFSAQALDHPKEPSARFLGIDTDGAPQGFIAVETIADAISGEPAAYVSLFGVQAAAEGRGLAQALLAAAEDWARAQGHRGLQLDVFASNARGRGFYAKSGFQPDSLRLVKPLSA